MARRDAAPVALDDRPVSTWTLLRTLIAARVRSQLTYRASFATDLLGQVLQALLDFAEIYVLLHNAPVLGGMTFTQAAVVYGLSAFAFGLADMVFGQLDTMVGFIRSGRLETLLVRPVPLLVQLVTSDVQLRRLGRAGFGLAAYAVALGVSGVDWTPWRVALAVLAPVGGFVIFGALFLASGCLHFWVIDGQQAGNTITYGGRYVSSVPAGALLDPVRVFFTFVVPATLVAYVPAAVLLGTPLPAFLWGWLAWVGLPVGIVLWAVVLLLWRAGVRRYTGAGG